MDRKRKNPFAGMTNPSGNNANLPENMSMKELTEELQRMEKILGKERFNLIMEEAREQYENTDDDYADDDAFLDHVTTYEWSQTHPALLVCASDKYYAELANHICDMICTYDIRVNERESLARELGRVLAAYLEDIVSGTKVFSAMRRVCHERYGYRLPFYDCEHEDYMPDHINDEDIRFLIWKTVCLYGKEDGKTYSPLAPGWELLAERIFDELNSRFEEAPEATRVADWLKRSLRKGAYMDIREVAAWLVFRNPLCYFPGFLDAIHEEAGEAVFNEEFDQGILEKLTYAYLSQESWQRSMSPMGCPTKTLEAAIAKELGYDSMAKDIEAIEVLPRQLYAVSQNRKSRQIFFENPDNEKIPVVRESFAKGFRPDEIEYAQCILVKYKGKYLLCGVLNGDPSLKSEWEKRETLPSYTKQRQQAQKWIELLEGKQVVCVKDIRSLYAKLNLPERICDDIPEAKNYIVLLSKELGIAVIPDGGYAFSLPDNRFFRKRKAAEDSFGDLVFHNSLTYDVAVYIQEHHLLPEARIGASQGKDAGHRIVQDYLAFWIGFYCELPAYGDAPRAEYYGEEAGELP